MAGRARWPRTGIAAALLLVAGCAKPKPVDGGRPLDEGTISGPLEEAIAHDPCMRMERGHWHQSVGHCRAMAPQQRLQGVWLRGFEVSEFVAGARSLAEAAAKEERAHEIEIDEASVQRLAGTRHEGPGA